MVREAAVQASQEVDAAVVIVFPAVLAVENDAHQRGAMAGVAARRVADPLQLADEVVHRMLGHEALVVEPDHVAHGVVAEHHLQTLPLLFHPPRPIEHLRVAQKPVAVARNPAVGRAGEDLLVGGDPLEARVGHVRNHLLADRAFRGPHASRLLPEQLLVQRYRTPHVLDRVFRIAVQVLGQMDVGHRPLRQPLVP